MNRTNRFLFQVTFVFLLLLTIPLDPSYYQKLFSQTGGYDVRRLFQFLDYVPYWGHPDEWGPYAFLGWLWVLIAALAIATVWHFTDRNFEARYDKWNDFLRIILRYRLALALLTYGILLLFPLQVPFPSLSDLHTKYGEFLPWKIYYHSLGVSSAGYEPVLGLAEILAGTLLLWRRTTVVGAGLAAAILINVILVNFAYDLGAHVLSIYLLLIAGVLLWHDTPRLYTLLVKEAKATADHYVPAFSVRALTFRRIFRAVFALFFLFYGFRAYSSYTDKHGVYPDKEGIAGAAGYYNVAHFTLNGQERPYSLTDTVRWQNVVFEKWNTISVRVNRRLQPDLRGPFVGIAQDYESEGNGGRLFYTYTLGGDSLKIINKNDSLDVYSFHINRTENTIQLDGTNAYGEALHIELNRLDKRYLLHLGRRKPVKVY